MAILLSLPLLGTPAVCLAAAATDPDCPAIEHRLRHRRAGLRFLQGWPDDHPEFLRIDGRLDDDHLARRIDRAVDGLDLTDLFDSYDQTGSTAFPPDLLLKVVLYELNNKRRSPSLWSNDAYENDPVRWLAHGLEPAPSSCYRFRQRLGPRLLELNRQVLHHAVETELTPATRGAQDGSTFAANASRHRMLNETSLQRRLEQLDQVCSSEAVQSPTVDDQGPATPTDQHTLATLAERAAPPTAEANAAAGANPAVEPLAGSQQEQPGSANTESARQPWWMAQTAAGRERQHKCYEQAKERLNERRVKEDRLPRERVVISPADSEAVPGLDKFKVFRPLFNVQLVVDVDSPLILGYQTFAQSHDGGTFKPLMKRTEWLVGHPLHEALADSSYATGPNLADAYEMKVLLYAPWQSNDVPDSAKANKAKQIPKEEFVWLEEESYRCPEGHRLDFVRERL